MHNTAYGIFFVLLALLQATNASASDEPSTSFFVETLTEIDSAIEAGGLRCGWFSHLQPHELVAQVGIGVVDVSLKKTMHLDANGNEVTEGFVATPVFLGISTRGTFVFYGEFGLDVLELLFKDHNNNDPNGTASSDTPDPYVSIGVRWRFLRYGHVSVYNKWYRYDGSITTTTTTGHIVGVNVGASF